VESGRASAQLRLVDDAHEPARCGCDDFLARQRSAAAFDQMAVLRRFIGAVDVQVQVARRSELGGTDAEFGQASRRTLRARYDRAELGSERLQQLDQDIDRAARADAE
jgi:hypothetical protein